MNIKDWIRQWATFSPSKIVVREDETGRSLTYQKLDALVNKVCWSLKNEYGLKKGDNLAVISGFSLEYVILLGAAMRMGICLIPVNYRLSPREIAYIIENGEPALLLFEKDYRELMEEPVPCQEFKRISMEGFFSKSDRYSKVKPFPSVYIEDDARMFIIYTSGTTGFPKGAIYTYKMAFWNAVNTTLRLNLSAYDHTVINLPPFHTGGWNVLLTPLLLLGGSFTLMRKFEPDRTLKLLDEEQVTLFMAVPTMIKMMADSPVFEKANLQSLRYFMVGGEPLPIPVIELWAGKGISIRQGYGLTECGPNITSLHHKDAIRKKGSIGQPNFYVETRLVDGKGKEVPNGEIGELLIRGPIVTPGYWKMPEATAESINDGWFHTGDLLIRDTEGYLYVKDRIKNLYISGGENVYPSEVEHFLRTHEAIKEIAIIGVAHPKWGETGMAFVVMNKGHKMNAKSLVNWCQGRLAKYKIPSYVQVVDELPKNDTGKINRKVLKGLVEVEE